MAKQRYVNTRFWRDKYIRSLAPTGKLLFLYLITSPMAEICGAYEVTTDDIALDTGLGQIEIMAWMDKFTADDKATYQDDWLFVHNAIEHQTITNPKIRAGIENTAKCCPDWIKYRLSITYDWLSHLNL